LYGLNTTSKRKRCMITNTNMATLTTCDFWRENTIRKYYQQCSACRGLFNIVKYIVCIIYSTQIRNNIMTWCKSAPSIFQMKNKRLLLPTSTSTMAAQCVGQLVDLALFNNQMHF